MLLHDADKMVNGIFGGAVDRLFFAGIQARQPAAGNRPFRLPALADQMELVVGLVRVRPISRIRQSSMLVRHIPAIRLLLCSSSVMPVREKRAIATYSDPSYIDLDAGLTKSFTIGEKKLSRVPPGSL